jgi:hypothetical protein
MNRREFLLTGAAIWVAGPARAQMNMMDHGMSGMQHGPMMRPAPAAGPVLPEAAQLRELPRLENVATEEGLFEAELTAGPATARFADGLDTPMLASMSGAV